MQSKRKNSEEEQGELTPVQRLLNEMITEGKAIVGQEKKMTIISEEKSSSSSEGDAEDLLDSDSDSLKEDEDIDSYVEKNSKN